MQWVWVLIVVLLGINDCVDASMNKLHVQAIGEEKLYSKDSSEDHDLFRLTFLVSSEENLDSVRIKFRLLVDNTQLASDGVPTSSCLFGSTPLPPDNWGAMTITGEQGVGFWVPHLDAKAALVYTMTWYDNYPRFGSATIEVSSKQGYGTDTWEKETTANGFRELPLEEACHKLVVRPPYW